MTEPAGPNGREAIAASRSDRGSPSSRSTTLTAAGVTLLGVLLSIGVTVGTGVSGPWWMRVAAGAASTLVLIVVVKVSTRTGRGPLARLANWTIGAPSDP